MADSSTLTLGTGRSLDLSAFDSRLAETSKEHLFLGSTSQDIEDGMPQVETRVVLVGEAGNDDKLLKALEAVKVMEVPVVRIKGGEPGSESGNTFIKTIVNMEIKVPCIKTCNVKEFGDGENTEFETIFILTDFECPEYGYLYKKDNRILGPPVVLHCAAKEEPLPFSSRPLYCTTMLNLVLCFTGFRKKEEVVKLVNLAHYMGGTIRRDFSSKVTHLIANSTHGEKFRVAVSMGTPILKTEWIYKAWEKRNEPNFCAAAEEFRLEFKVPPFQDCVLSFLGFSDEDKASMEDMTEMQGGRYLDVGDVRCTHMVVEENTIKELPFEPSKKLYVVKQEWFWGSIQMDARAGESMYFYEKAGSPTLKKSVSLLSLNTPNSNRKRRRLQDTLAQLTRETDISPFPPRKRTSAEHSLSMGSLLDISNTPESGKATGDYTPHRVVTQSRKNCSRTPGNRRPTRHSQRRRNERAKQNIPEKEGQLEIDLQQRSGVNKASVYLRQAKQEQMQLQDRFSIADEEEEFSGMQISYNFSQDDCMTEKSDTFHTSETKACESQATLEQIQNILNVLSSPFTTFNNETGGQKPLHFSLSESEIGGLEPDRREQELKPLCSSTECLKDVSLDTNPYRSISRRYSCSNVCLLEEVSAVEDRVASSAVSEYSVIDTSIGNSFDEMSAIENKETPRSVARPSKSSTPVPQKQSARWQVAKELYQTENNYVDILTTVLQLFKDPLEKEGQLGGPILAVEEIKTIFGSIPDIFDVHTRIKAELEELVLNWSEDKSVGDIILKYSKELVKAYPPFVNFFEMSKETIAKCEKQKPRFHAFLKINQAKPECGRQTLAELLIRPVQRLPSVALLLNDIRKHTADDNPDKVTLEKAIESLKEVMTHINEDKRKTEGQKQIFDVVYEVDNCPANLLSSHRSLVHRVETISLGDQPCDRGENVTLFLFNDCLEIARKRHKVISTFRSPHGGTRPQASLKHITLMPLSQIRKVLDLKETEDCHNAFALVVRPPTEQDNLLFSFQLTAEDTFKEDWLRMLCRHVANTICKADAENLIQCTDPDSLQVNTKDMDSSTLSRASRAIKKTSKKVTRAFSFTKTPKRVIQRAFLANSTPDSPTSGTGNYLGGRLASTSSLAISRSSSTFSLNCSARHANVHRSNSLDASSPSSRLRVPICNETPSSPKKHISNNRVSTSCTSNASPTAQISSVPTITTAFEPSEQSPQSVSHPQRSSLVTRRETLL